MDKHSPQYFKHLALQLRFELTDAEAKDIANEFDVLIDQLQLLEAIDTTSVEPLVYPFEAPTTFLRDDEPTQVLSPAEALKNAPQQINGFFVTKKVVV
jgi:aspartyl-tRNA(Asn)/glutamyl-tRNA(Gln) amidotransferase subunit C